MIQLHEVGYFSQKEVTPVVILLRIMMTLIMIFSLVLPGRYVWATQSNRSSKQQQTIDLKVTDTGFEPKALKVAPHIPTILAITRISDATCSSEIVIPSLKIKKTLPLGKTVLIEIGELNKGEIKFGCGMNMMDHGMIMVN